MNIVQFREAVAKEGTGNTIFLDGNIATMEQTLHRLQGMTDKGKTE
jgi:tartrate dehydratase beta subunit/fumarate hydratase class I family protein